MNEQLKEVLLAMLSSAVEVKDFLVAETPEVIQQLLAWEFTISLLGFIMGLSFTVGTYFAARSFLKYLRTEDSEEFILVMLLPLSLGIAALINNLTWLKIWIAPKLFLLEYASNLIK